MWWWTEQGALELQLHYVGIVRHSRVCACKAVSEEAKASTAHLLPWHQIILYTNTHKVLFYSAYFPLNTQSCVGTHYIMRAKIQGVCLLPSSPCSSSCNHFTSNHSTRRGSLPFHSRFNGRIVGRVTIHHCTGENFSSLLISYLYGSFCATLTE